MIGARTALIFSLFAGLAYAAGQQQFARDLVGPSSTWKSRLQILVGRPAPPEPIEPIGSARAPEAPPAERATPRDGSAPGVPAPRADRPADDRATRTAGLDEVEPFAAQFVAIDGANLRSAPSLDASRIDVIGRGSKLSVTGRSLDRRWLRVRHRGRTLFISTSTVRPEWVETSLGEVRLDEVGGELDAMAEELKRARFREVVRAARPLRLKLDRAARWVSLDADVVRLELMTATAEIALGRQSDAELSLERALSVDRGLQLDPTRSPPKLRRLLAQVRSLP